VIANETPKELV